MISRFLDAEAGLSELVPQDIAALLGAAADLVLLLDSAGVIEDLSCDLEPALVATIEQWRGRALVDVIAAGSRATLRSMLGAARARRHSLRQVLRHGMAAQDELVVAYQALAFGNHGRVLLLGRDQRPWQQMQTRLMSERMAHERRRRAEMRDDEHGQQRPRVASPSPSPSPVPAGDTSLDARLGALLGQLAEPVVLTDTRGVMVWSNDCFRRLIGKHTRDALDGVALADYLQIEPLEWPALLANARRYAGGPGVRGALQPKGMPSRDVAVAIVALLDETPPAVGFFLRLIDVTSTDTARDVELFRSAEELTDMVGKVPLKGMVRDATDKVEKMCIEAALRLTGNNRALAAKVLGMSRQGLYQKLNQFQLVDSEELEDEGER